MDFLKWVKTLVLPGPVQIAKHALGRYIILFASLLHFIWAGLIIYDERATKSTPIYFMYLLCQGDEILLTSILIIVAILAMLFLDLRIRKHIPLSALSLLLLPQQFLLWISAGAGIYSTWVGHYADYVTRSHTFILTDQLPIILTACLYTIVLFESRHPPINLLHRLLKEVNGEKKSFWEKGEEGYPLEKGEKGEPGEKGEKGEKGDPG